MYVRRFVPLSLLVALTSPGCGSGGSSAAGTDGGVGSDSAPGIDGESGSDDRSTAEVGSGSDGSNGVDGAVGPEDIDQDLPLPLAAGIAPTPPMGWNSWNSFSTSVSEALIKQVADVIVSSGMKDSGYQYVNIDDGWACSSSVTVPGCQGARAPDGTVQISSNFPNGIQAVADYVHSKGLKLGIYSDRGTETCGSRAGSQGYETNDATSYAAWGVDYLKYDNCNTVADPQPQAVGSSTQTQYQTMRGALDATGRPFVYSLCAWAFYEWGVGMGNLWRTTSDIQPNWASVFGNVMSTRYLAAYAGPNRYIGDPNQNMGASTAADARYGWNDSDMLEVGRSGLTDIENQSHFSLWAITAAPLIAGNDLRTMSLATKNILTNKEIIALNQDALGLQGFPVRMSGDQSVWAKPLNKSGDRAVVLLNAGAAAADITFQLDEIGLRSGSATVRDLVAQKDLGGFQDSYAVLGVPSHGTATLRVSGTEPPRPHGTAYLSDLTWTYAANGLGTVHKDESNASSAPVTGVPISLRGTKYTKGLGVDGPSLVIYRLAQKCTSFSADVGVDDITGGTGSVVFQVWIDGEKLFDSGTTTGASPAQPVQVRLDGKRRLKLLVTNAGDGNGQDRADWANAQVVCDP